jgi:hypothetical protein
MTMMDYIAYDRKISDGDTAPWIEKELGALKNHDPQVMVFDSKIGRRHDIYSNTGVNKIAAWLAQEKIVIHGPVSSLAEQYRLKH